MFFAISLELFLGMKGHGFGSNMLESYGIPYFDHRAAVEYSLSSAPT